MELVRGIRITEYRDQARHSAQDDEVLAMSDALEQLAAEDQGLADLVKLKFFFGMTNKDVAELLGVSGPTVERRWALARAWMFRVLRE